MSTWTSRRALRWLVPGAVAVLAVGGGAAASALTAPDGPDLPSRTAAELLLDLQTSQVGAMSGTLVTTVDLGLPALPQGGGTPDTPDTPDMPGTPDIGDLGALLDGSHTWQVWYDGPQRVRVAQRATTSEAQIIRNGPDLWVWDSEENRATHHLLPERESAHPSPLPVTPRVAADAALAAIEPSTEVSADETTRVAGRDAYELVLAPRDSASLLTEIRVAIDAEESIPLQVQVYGNGTEPAIEVQFTHLSFDSPDPEQFRFNPPPGTEVTEEGELLPSPPMAGSPSTEDQDWPELTVVGEGWTRVLVARLPEEDSAPAALERLLPEGEARSASLFSVLRTADGRVLAGLVTPEHLAEVADDPAAALPQE